MRSHLTLLVLTLAAALTMVLLTGGQRCAAATNLYFTQFEPGEGFNPNLDLIGQGGWVGAGSGGNGLVSNFFAGEGQQAFIGFSPPAPGEDLLFVWRPVDFDPLAVGLPLVTFSVLMSIEDSSITNGQYDFFQWSVYNLAGDRLFTLDFDNFTTNVSYLLDGTNDFVATGVTFTPGVSYPLTLTMNFASNRWSAALGASVLATNQPLTTTNAQLTLGDVDATWLLYDPDAPGDNYLLFDNYRITAEPLMSSAIPSAQLRMLGYVAPGWGL